MSRVQARLVFDIGLWQNGQGCSKNLPFQKGRNHVTVRCLLVNENVDSLESTYHSEAMNCPLGLQHIHLRESPFE
jgi:hypothetical protein